MFRTISLAFLFCFITSTLFAQKNVGDTYKATAVSDSTYGIIMYNALIGPVGGDSTRYDAMKLPLQGLVIDMYDNGQMLHKGSYDKGKLVSFNNYFPDGKKERSFVTLSPTMANLKVFYENGKVRSEVDYKGGEAKRWTDFYENGQVEYMEEYSGDMAYLLSRKAFKENGKPDYDLELLSSKNRKYEQKEFYPDGKLHEKGDLLYFADVGDLRKDGTWQTYSERGNLILAQHYTKGEVTETQDSLALASSVLYTKQTEASKKKEKEQQEAENKKAAEKEKQELKNAQIDTAKLGYATKQKIVAEQKKEAQKKEIAQKETEKKEIEKKKTEEREKKITEKRKNDSLQFAVKKQKDDESRSKVLAQKTEEKNKSEVTSQKPEEKKKEETKKTTASHSPSVVPVEFKYADKDKNGKISAPEVSGAINAFFDDETGKLKAGDISKLIDYFFDQ